MITDYIGGGLAKWLQYYIGVAWPNDYNITMGGVVKSDFTFEFTTTTTKTMIWNVAFIQGFQHCLNWIGIFVANAFCRNLHVIFAFSGGYGQMITILHRGGVGPNDYRLHRGGGVCRDPQKWLRNIWMTPYKRLRVPFISFLEHSQIPTPCVKWSVKREWNIVGGRQWPTICQLQKYSRGSRYPLYLTLSPGPLCSIRRYPYK